MSYQIEFNRQFLRSARGITPLVLFGSNDFSEFFRGKNNIKHERVIREWCPFLDMVGVSETELMEEVKTHTGRTKQHWKRHGKFLDDAAMIRWCITGIRDAMTLEEIRQQNPGLSLRCGIETYHESIWLSSSLSRRVNTSDELDKWIDAVRETTANSADGVTHYFVLKFDEDDLLVRKQHRFDGLAVVKYKKLYLCALGGDRVFCDTKYPDTPFPSFDDAMQAAVNAGLRPFRIIPALGTSYVIREDGTYNHGMYYAGTKRRRACDTDDINHAKKYSSRTLAARTAQRLMEQSYNGSSIRTVLPVSTV